MIRNQVTTHSLYQITCVSEQQRRNFGGSGLFTLYTFTYIESTTCLMPAELR